MGGSEVRAAAEHGFPLLSECGWDGRVRKLPTGTLLFSSGPWVTFLFASSPSFPWNVCFSSSLISHHQLMETRQGYKKVSPPSARSASACVGQRQPEQGWKAESRSKTRTRLRIRRCIEWEAPPLTSSVSWINFLSCMREWTHCIIQASTVQCPKYYFILSYGCSSVFPCCDKIPEIKIKT